MNVYLIDNIKILYDMKIKFSVLLVQLMWITCTYIAFGVCFALLYAWKTEKEMVTRLECRA